MRVYDALQERVHPQGLAGLPAGGGSTASAATCATPTVSGAPSRAIDGVVHLAAYQDYMPDFSTYFAVNTVGTALLFEIAVSLRLPLRKIVLASSQAVYGEGSYRCGGCGTVHPPARSGSSSPGATGRSAAPPAGAPPNPCP